MWEACASFRSSDRRLGCAHADPHRARSERTARSCVGVRQLLAVDWEIEIVAAVADQPSQAEFDAIKAKALA